MVTAIGQAVSLVIVPLAALYILLTIRARRRRPCAGDLTATAFALAGPLLIALNTLTVVDSAAPTVLSRRFSLLWLLMALATGGGLCAALLRYIRLRPWPHHLVAGLILCLVAAVRNLLFLRGKPFIGDDAR